MAAPAEGNLQPGIGIRIRELRHRRGWSQQELAKRVGVDPVNVSRWERHIHAVSFSNIERMASAFGVSLDVMKGEAPIPEKLPSHAPPSTTDAETDLRKVARVWVAHVESLQIEIEQTFKILQDVIGGLYQKVGAMTDQIRILADRLEPWEAEDDAETRELSEMFEEAKVQAALRATEAFDQAAELREEARRRELDERRRA